MKKKPIDTLTISFKKSTPTPQKEKTSANKKKGITKQPHFNDIQKYASNIGKKLFGIDRQIESVLEQIVVYMQMPSFNSKPLVINLWGATGTGKTELVKTVLKELNIEKLAHYYNMVEIAPDYMPHYHDVEPERSSPLSPDFNPAKKNKGAPVVLVFDDFQHIRFLNSMGEARTGSPLYRLFRIMDEGFKDEEGNPIPTIIFNTGNIELSHNENVDNWFQKPGKQIEPETMPLEYMQKALSRHFRPEMVARMQNVHLFFPSIGRDVAAMIIRRELSRITKAAKKELALTSCTYDEHAVETIMGAVKNIGMGARTLESTTSKSISQLIFSLLKDLANQHSIPEDLVTLHFSGGRELNLSLKGTTGNDQKLNVSVSLKEKPPYDVDPDPQTLIIQAVHEAGHAVLTYMLHGKPPEEIFIGLKGSSTEGYVKIHSSVDHITKKFLTNRIAVILGGYLAEKMLFELENTTIGAKADFEHATKIAMDMINKFGFGNHRRRTVVGYEPFADHEYPPMDKEDMKMLNKLMESAESKAQRLLEEQKQLLMAIAQRLYEDKEIQKEEFMKLVDKHLLQEDGMLNVDSDFDYVGRFTDENNGARMDLDGRGMVAQS